MPRVKASSGDLSTLEDSLAEGDEQAAQIASLDGRIKQIRVVWGEELFQPIQFHMVRVGPIEATVDVRPGDDPAVIAKQAWSTLDAIAREQFDEKIKSYLGRIKEVGAQAKRTRTG